MQNSSAPVNPGLPGAGRALALLLAINLFNYLDRQVLAAVEPHIRAAFFDPGDLSARAKTGALATAFLLSYMVMAPVFGWLADRFSRWLLIAVSVALWSGFREWPRDVERKADVDSGPIVQGIGAAATAFGLIAARAVGDDAVHQRLAATATAAEGLGLGKGVKDTVLAAAIRALGD
jgi:MFS family permease